MEDFLRTYNNQIISFLAVLTPLILSKIASIKKHKKIEQDKAVEMETIKGNQNLIRTDLIEFKDEIKEEFAELKKENNETSEKIDKQIFNFLDQKYKCNQEYQTKKACKDIRCDIGHSKNG